MLSSELKESRKPIDFFGKGNVCNLLSPAIGNPIFLPTQDVLIGLYVLTSGNRRGICANRNNP